MGLKFDTLQWKAEHGIGWIILNRPDKLGAMNEHMMEEIRELLEIYKKEKDINIVIFIGTGKAFATGADINDLQKMGPMDALNPTMQSLYERIYQYPKITIAGINGYALGGGMELAASCDIRIAADTAIFGLPECNLGVIPGAGGTQRLVRLIGEAKVKEIVLLGHRISAEQAKTLGFVSKVVPLDALEQTLVEVGRNINSRGPLALQLAKKSIQSSYDIPPTVGSYLENLSQAFLFTSKDKQEGVNAFLEKRKPNFSGS